MRKFLIEFIVTSSTSRAPFLDIPSYSKLNMSYKFVPGEEGSDYFDVFQNAKSFLTHFFMLSFSSYRLSSLFLSTYLEGIEEVQQKDWSPHEVWHFFVERLGFALRGEDKIHLFYGILDHRFLELEYILVGEMEAFFCSHVQRKVELLPFSFSEPFSMGGESPSSSLKMSLSSQDKMVIGSYGLHQLGSLLGRPAPLGQGTFKETIELNWRAKGDILRDQILLQAKDYAKVERSPLWPRDVSIGIMEIESQQGLRLVSS